MDLERTSGSLRAVDEAKNSVRLSVSGFEQRPVGVSVQAALETVDTGPPVPAERIDGVVSAISFPSVFVKVIELGAMSRESFSNGQQSMSLPDGEYLIRIAGNVRAFVRFSGGAELAQADVNRKQLRFEKPTPVSIGFESRAESPKHTITVEESVAGAATAVTYSSATTINTSPDRTWPTQRDYPPRVEFDEETAIPRQVRELRPETGIRVVIPPTLEYVFTTAPLAQYLGARVELLEGVEPQVRLPDRTVRLGSLPETEQRVADLLKRTFFFDCVARGAGPHGGYLAVSEVFEDLGLDAERLYDAPIAERVQTYLASDFESVRNRFPEWHLAMYVKPSMDHVQTLPHLLNDLPLIQLPQSRQLSKKEWLDLSFQDSFEDSPEDLLDNQVTRVRREISNVDLVEPELTDAMAHGWMADDVPIDVFKTFPRPTRTGSTTTTETSVS